MTSTAELQAAQQELLSKSLHDIQVETARTWARRAWAAYSFAASVSYMPDADRQRWLYDASEYEHEALEHAALTRDPEVLAEVGNLIDHGRTLAGAARVG